MTVDDAIEQVARELNIERCVVKRVYYSMFEFILNTTAHMPLKEEFLDKKEFNELHKVFLIPRIGKVTIPYYKYNAIWEGYTIRKHLGKNSIKYVQNKKA